MYEPLQRYNRIIIKKIKKNFFSFSENRMILNRETCEILELFSSNKGFQKSDKEEGKYGACLLSVLDECLTSCGRKALRNRIESNLTPTLAGVDIAFTTEWLM